MEGNSKRLCNIIGKYNNGIDDEDLEVAETLVDMKYAKLEDETILKLQDMKEKFLHKKAARYKKLQLCTGSKECNRQRNPERHRPGKEVMIQPEEQARHEVPMNVHTYETPEFGYSIDGIKLPSLPHVKSSLHEIIGACGHPFEKQLTPSDVMDHLNRLSFNKEDLERAFEPLLVHDRDRGREDPERGIPLTLYNEDGRKYKMKYKTWAKNKFHVLTGDWKKFYRDHRLRQYEDWVAVWMFRHQKTDELCCILTSKRLPIHALLSRKKNRGV